MPSTSAKAPLDVLEYQPEGIEDYLRHRDMSRIPLCYKQEQNEWSVIYNPRTLRQVTLGFIARIDTADLVRFSPDDDLVATSRLSYGVDLVAIANTNALTHLPHISRNGGVADIVTDIHFSPNGKSLLTSTYNGDIRVGAES